MSTEAWCNHDPAAVRMGRCECGHIVDRAKVVAMLTRTQRQALATLEERGTAWATENSTDHRDRFARRTLNALVAVGLAEYVTNLPGVMPYYRIEAVS